MMQGIRNWVLGTLIALTVSVGVTALSVLPVTSQTVTSSPRSYPSTLGTVASRFYPLMEGGGNTGTAFAGTLDTVLYVSPFIVKDYPITAASINVRLVTGIATCGIKIAVWAHSPTTKRGTGTPIAGSNTGQACTVAAPDPTVAVSYTFAPGAYWFGFAVTGAAATFQSQANNNYAMTVLVGRSALGNNTLTALSSTIGGTFNYSNDIMATSITGATWTDVINTIGAPVLYLGT